MVQVQEARGNTLLPPIFIPGKDNQMGFSFPRKKSPPHHLTTAKEKPINSQRGR
jgi:hypothetical protein